MKKGFSFLPTLKGIATELQHADEVVGIDPGFGFGFGFWSGKKRRE